MTNHFHTKCLISLRIFILTLKYFYILQNAYKKRESICHGQTEILNLKENKTRQARYTAGVGRVLAHSNNTVREYLQANAAKSFTGEELLRLIPSLAEITLSVMKAIVEEENDTTAEKKLMDRIKSEYNVLNCL